MSAGPTGDQSHPQCVCVCVCVCVSVCECECECVYALFIDCSPLVLPGIMKNKPWLRWFILTGTASLPQVCDGGKFELLLDLFLSARDMNIVLRYIQFPLFKLDFPNQILLLLFNLNVIVHVHLGRYIYIYIQLHRFIYILFVYDCSTYTNLH